MYKHLNYYSEKHTIDQSNQKKKKLRQKPAVGHKKTLNHPTRITDANRIGEGRNPTDESLKKQRAKENKDVEILLAGEMSRGRVEREGDEPPLEGRWKEGRMGGGGGGGTKR